VADHHGRPVRGASVEVLPSGGLPLRATTDSYGVARVAFESEISDGTPVTVHVTYGPYEIRQEYRASEGQTGVFMRLPVCVSEPLITTAEAVALALGAAITLAGFVWKQEAAKIGGEILAGAAVFTLVYRHSCAGS
jgi:hypothetical protein